MKQWQAGGSKKPEKVEEAVDMGSPCLAHTPGTQLGGDSYTLRQPVQEGPALHAWALEVPDQFSGHPREEHTLHLYSHLLLTTAVCGRN